MDSSNKGLNQFKRPDYGMEFSLDIKPLNYK